MQDVFAIDKYRSGSYNDRVEQEPLAICKYGDNVLHCKAVPIREINAGIIELAGRMALTMKLAPGVGLAAPQVGQSLRLVVMDPSSGEDEKSLMVFINPLIIEQEGEETCEEGCLSVPGYTLNVTRSKAILLEALDLQGREIRLELRDYPARIIQHELDHLDGFLIVDRISTLKRSLIRAEIKKLRKRGQW